MNKRASAGLSTMALFASLLSTSAWAAADPLLVDVAHVDGHKRDSNWRIVDVRPRETYANGHILPLESLQQRYATLPRDRKVIVDGNMNKQSASLYFNTRRRGYDMANDDGSWHPWSANGSQPVQPNKSHLI